MSNYIRAHLPGGSFFFTVITYNRYPIFKSMHSRRLLKKSWLTTIKKRPFFLEAICLLPEHIHFIMRLPENDIDYSTRISSMKAHFTKYFLEENHGKGFFLGYRDKGERTVWQHRFWEHMIRDEDDLIKHIEYIHFNPVKHGLVNRVQDWSWSSFHRYVLEDIYPLDWGGELTVHDSKMFGE